MSTKSLNIDQHLPLHNLYPDNCCLCKAEQKIKELEAKLSAWYNIFETSQLTHAQGRLEQAEKEVKQLKRKLSIDSKEVCDICWTSSYLPVPKNTKDSLKVKGKDYNVICQMCEADKLMLQLTKAISPDGSITKTIELINLCKKLWDVYNKTVKKNLI